MRPRVTLAALGLVAGVLAWTVPRTSADTKVAEPKKEAGKALKVDGELTADDPKEGDRHFKTYPFKMTAGKTYVIDMISKEGNPKKFDPYLRLLNPGGKKVAEDDDGGGFPNARIQYSATETGTYKIIATTFAPGMTGKFVLTAKETVISAAAVAFGKAQQAFQMGMVSLNKEFKVAPTEAEKQKIIERFHNLVVEAIEALVKLADENAKDPVTPKIQADLRAKLQMISGSEAPAVAKLMRSLMEKSSDPGLRAQAGITLGNNLRARSEKAYQKKDKALSVKLAGEAETLLTKLAKDSIGAPARMAEDTLFLLRNLSVGKVAPEIEGEDLDSKKFKLTDYRGKVVVLDFWGNW
jgi:hypothetical protein